MNAIKSISTINTTAGWAIRVRLTTGKELFSGMTGENGHKLTLHEAEATAVSLRRDIARHGTSQIRGDELPSDVRIIK
ncbi:MAG: hypothetical protein Q7K26_06230 [bacterium]|nr:hypothetical protein [bacterium]